MKRALILAAAAAVTTALSVGHAVAAPPVQPIYTIDYTCGEGVTLLIEVIDDDPFRYDVFIDDELVIDFESDPDGVPWEFGPFDFDARPFVEIYWYESVESDPQLLADGIVSFECGPDDTGVPTTEVDGGAVGGGGATLPSTGGSDVTLIVGAFALLATGGALLATRRRHGNA